MRWIVYNFAFLIVFIAMMPHYLLRMKKRGGYRAKFAERFGRYETPPPEISVWVHAVSVGEIIAVWPFIEAIRSRFPETRFVISTTTSTGYAEAQKRLREHDRLIYAPLDFLPCCKRALETIKPRAILIMETELWPNFLRLASRRKIPLFLLNARLSDKSAPTYRRLRFWFGQVLQTFTRIFAQSQLDADRFLAAGARAEQIRVVGSSKFDAVATNPAKEKEIAEFLEALDLKDKSILLGASTWHGEEELLVEIFQRIAPQFPDLRLVLIPRHFERSGEIVAMLKDKHCAPHSKRAMSAPRPFEQHDVLVADTTGEMAGFYPRATIVFVGRTIPPNKGGQNMIEPCFYGRATIVGTNTQNFRPVMADLLAADAIIQVNDAASLEAEIVRLLTDAKSRGTLGERAHNAVENRRGVIDRCAEEICKSIF